MLPASFTRNLDRNRLRNLLGVFFLALAVPTAAIVWQAYDRLKWEAWFQYRSQAEALVERIDGAIGERVRTAESHRFGDFAFLSATAAANVQQRSPLSAYPVSPDVPGLIGYFQVGPDGTFSTPLLPSADLGADDVGLTDEELGRREALAADIRRILRDNRLVDGEKTLAATPAEAAPQRTAAASLEVAEALESGNEQTAADPAVAEPGPMADAAMTAFSVAESQVDANAGVATYGKIDELRLDEDLARRNEERKRQVADRDDAATRLQNQPAGSRMEKATAPAASPPAVGRADKEEDAITTFASEIDPFEFSLLGSGHVVLYRNAWREGRRYVQGLLIEQAAFSRDLVEAAFLSDTLAGMSDLIVGYRDDVIAVIRGDRYDGIAASAGQLQGSLLYRSRLSAPFDSVELVFAVNRLPAGPGGSVLAWTSAVLAIVFLGGFLLLYRLGLGQIRLAQQQQDFVSAVSHELKTPLTSIRMYGEMLKEGWVEPGKQKQYLAYIHDESERLSRLISNVLELAKITRGKPQLNMRPVAVGQLIDQVRSKIASHVERAGFELALVADEKTRSASVTVDEDCFSQVVINLVDNAIKFSRDASRRRIEIGCRRNADDGVTFSVRDFGPGIPGDRLRRIFELFYRGESELTRETVGTGIGLAIVHQLTLAMGGEVDVVNASPGAEFRVTLPT